MVNIFITTVRTFRRLFHLLKALAALLFFAIWLTIRDIYYVVCIPLGLCLSMNPNLDDAVYRLQTYSSPAVRLEALCLPTSQVMVASGRNFRRPFRPPTLVHPVLRMSSYPFHNVILTHQGSTLLPTTVCETVKCVSTCLSFTDLTRRRCLAPQW
jgi:hypothetical protein